MHMSSYIVHQINNMMGVDDAELEKVNAMSPVERLKVLQAFNNILKYQSELLTEFYKM